MLIGFVATKLFRLPSWITPAICFNNTTSLPLLLIQSLDATGILSKLLMSDSDTTSAAVQRAKSYFLVCAVVGNCLTFALGPRLLDREEDLEEEDEDKQDDGVGQNGDVEQGQDGHTEDEEHTDEQTSLLPDAWVRRGREAERETYIKGKHYWDEFPPWLRSVLDFLYQFLNGPLIGAAIGAALGLTPSLHKLFFNSQEEGGFFNAWLTTSVKNIGELFASLQVVVVGVKLSSSLRKLKRGDESGEVPWKPTLFVLVIRFIIWPA